MKFALLGSGRDALELARAAQRSQDHEVVLAFEPDDLIAATGIPPARVSWESLLDGSLADAVIVGSTQSPDRRATQLRTLVQAAVPLIVVHPGCEAIVGYELDMIRRDTGGVMIPYRLGASSPFVVRLQGMVRAGPDSPIGPIDQLVLERHLPDRRRQVVLDQFACDAILMRQILEEISHLSALGPQFADTSYSNLSVHMSGPARVVARWSVSPVVEDAHARLSLLGTTGRAVVALTEHDSHWTLEMGGTAAADQPEPVSIRLEPSSTLDTLADAIAGRESHPTWDDACRAIDLAETIDLSLRRGKTIQLHRVEPSEEHTFKGLMAIGGCGALLLTLVLVLLLALADSLGITGLDYWRHWPLYLLGFLGLFLLLQLLRLLFPKPAGSHDSPSQDNSPSHVPGQSHDGERNTAGTD